MAAIFASGTERKKIGALIKAVPHQGSDKNLLRVAESRGAER
jgi:hypothetical protein